MKNNQPKSGKGGKREGAGRKPGTPNKINTQLKEMILEALANAGGVKYLTEQAEAEPKAFLALIGKTLPMTVVGDASQPLTVKIVTGLGD